MNRAVMLRMAACGIMGLGAALLIAALLLSTYTGSRITKIPLDLDATLIGEGSGTTVDPASLYSPKLVVDKNVPVVVAATDRRRIPRQRRRRHVPGG